MAGAIKKERIINSWLTLVDHGAGNTHRIYEATENNLEHAQLPDVVWKHDVVSTGMFGKGRDFLVINHRALREYAMFINVRDYGQHLDCAWFVTCQPGLLKRALSRAAAGHPDALSANLDLFNKLDLEAWITAVHHAFIEPIRELKGELQQDIAGMNTQSKGYLSVW